MKKLFIIMLVLGSLITNVKAQVWQTVVSDGFEYTGTCPYLIPNTVWHYTPQTFAVYSGNTSLYMNFQDCNGGSGTCAGDLVFRRGFSVCRNQPLRFGAMLTTSFAGTQCNVRIEIRDGNGTVLDNQASIPANYAPSWSQYQSAVVTPVSDSVVFFLYTNVGGSPGNDLSMDDFLLEKTDGYQNSTVTGNVCTEPAATNLYSQIPGMNDFTGTWSGPSTLTGGYLGTYTNGVNTVGTYVYENHGFGFLPGCPMAYDSVVVQVAPSPTINLGTDTTLCTTQSFLLSAGNTPGYTYVWNNGVTGPNVLVFTTSQVAVTNTYSVTVTNAAGCMSHDTLLANFVICTGIGENIMENQISLYPNPSNGIVYVNNSSALNGDVYYSVINTLGETISRGTLVPGTITLPMPSTANGVYWFRVWNEEGTLGAKRFVITP